MCGALREFNARRLHARAVARGSGTAGGDSKPTAPVAQSRTPNGRAGGPTKATGVNERNEMELRTVRGKGAIIMGAAVAHNAAVVPFPGQAHPSASERRTHWRGSVSRG